jgi:hypothetical protein
MVADAGGVGSVGGDEAWWSCHGQSQKATSLAATQKAAEAKNKRYRCIGMHGQAIAKAAILYLFLCYRK